MDLTPAVDTHSAVSAGILALNTLTHPDGTGVDLWRQLDEHSERAVADLVALRDALPGTPFRLAALRELANDLLEAHDATGISLDAWVAAREFVEAYTGPITENGA